MNRTLLALAVVVLLAIPAGLAQMPAAEDKDAVPDVLVPNVLHVDAATGAASFEDHHEALTDVEVSGVASAASGFNLVDPVGAVVFQNQSSTHAGVVSFWQQALAPGVYGVFGPRPDGSGLVVTFETPLGAQPALGPAVSSPCLNAIKLGAWPSLNSDDASVCGISPPPVTSPCDHSSTCNPQVCDGGGVGCIADRLPCGGTGEPPCNATGLCQLLPSQCGVPLPTLGSCPDGKTGSTINGATTACVAVPKVGSCPSGKVGATVNDNPAACIGANPPCGTAASCEDYACSFVPCGVPSGPCLGSPSLADCLVDTGCEPAIDLCNTALGCATYPDACTPSVSAPDADPNDPPSADCSGDTSAVETTTKLAESTVWAPMLIIHSPYGGSAEAVGTWTESSGLFYAGNGKTSTLEGGYKTNTDDGKTMGIFRVAKWGYYEYYMNYRCGSYGTHYYYAKIIDDTPNGIEETRSFALWGNNQKTDRDDWQTVSGCGSSGKCYNSIRFDNQYVRRDSAWDTTGGGFHILVGSRTYQAGGATISFSPQTGPVSFALEASYVADKTTDTYFDYTLPAGGRWSGDRLGTSGSSALAFCDDLRNGNC
jgi:hypothetical protein